MNGNFKLVLVDQNINFLFSIYFILEGKFRKFEKFKCFIFIWIEY